MSLYKQLELARSKKQEEQRLLGEVIEKIESMLGTHCINFNSSRVMLQGILSGLFEKVAENEKMLSEIGWGLANTPISFLPKPESQNTDSVNIFNIQHFNNIFEYGNENSGLMMWNRFMELFKGDKEAFVADLCEIDNNKFQNYLLHIQR